MAPHTLTTAQRLAFLLGSVVRRASQVSEDCLTTDPRLLKITEDIVRLFRLPAVAERVRIDRRGRPRKHDAKWARDVLIALAIESPDGLPFIQKTLVDRLRLAFEDDGREVPGDTWLAKHVGDFYRSANMIEINARQQFRQSSDLQSAFHSEAAFVAFRKTRTMLERQWFESTALQLMHPTPQHYIDSRAMSGNLRTFEDERSAMPCHKS